ncbi:hypothetical protein TNCV_677671 [Trichonephila clavipes]|nr:hypothetical protein TNCV_677671 [Trichonephila clavipes]
MASRHSSSSRRDQSDKRYQASSSYSRSNKSDHVKNTPKKKQEWGVIVAETKRNVQFQDELHVFVVKSRFRIEIDPSIETDDMFEACIKEMTS